MDFIPQIKMDFIPDDKEDIDNDENPLVESDDEDEDEEELPVQPPPTEPIKEIVEEPSNPRDEMNTAEIFSNAPIKFKKNGQPKKARKPMSDDHKLKMKTAREKKQKEKRESMVILKQEKDLLRIKKVKEVTELKDEVENNIKPKQYHYSNNMDVEKAVLDGITKYEIVRKQRKLEKKQMKEEDEAKSKVQQTLLRAINPRDTNMFSGCY
tara:strand:- start:97 stop:726 length:630 start_codon:yes stop_codon:yes gene_type:complete